MGTYAKTYDSIAIPALKIIVPIQSMSEANCCHIKRMGLGRGSCGKTQKQNTHDTAVVAPARKNAGRHPTVSTNTPPRTRPSKNPSGLEKPKHENPRFRGRPWTMFVEMMETDAGTAIAFATPCRPRKAMSSPPVRAKPQAKALPTSRTLAASIIGLVPTTSAMDPANIKHDPAVR